MLLAGIPVFRKLDRKLKDEREPNADPWVQFLSLFNSHAGEWSL